MRPNTATNNTQRIKKIIFESYDEERQLLNLCTLDADSGKRYDDWRRALECRNWTAIRSLNLCNTAMTQIVVTSMTLGLNSSAVCHGPISNI